MLPKRLVVDHVWIVGLLAAISQFSIPAVVANPPAVVTSGQASGADDPMLRFLRQRALERPDHSETWRSIGRIERKLGRLDAAMQATSEAIRLDPNNAAAHFDFGEMLTQTGDPDRASGHFQRVFEIAPDSKYAADLTSMGVLPNTSPEVDVNWDHAFAGNSDVEAKVIPAGYKIQTFDGGDDLDRRLNQLRSDADPTFDRLRLFVETGALYNSNVSLTPISRELSDPNAASFQGFLNPEFEWIALQKSGWKFGPLGRGFFNVNESQQSNFDLASFQPGAFIERDIFGGASDLTARVDYVYSIDLLGGEQFGNRHSVTASVIKIRPDLDVLYYYVTTSFSDFTDDGADRTISSLDGTSVSLGVSRFFQTEFERMPTWSAGLDLETADTDGADFRYDAITFHSEAVIKLSDRLSFLPEFGIGGRDYGDFTGAVNRDELTWRVSGKLRWQHNDHLAVALVAGHDRFASDNDQFDAERTQGGIVWTISR